MENNNAHKPYFSSLKDYFMALLGIVSFTYLLNFSFGFIEFLPDSLPFIGNIDETVAVYFIYSSLTYFNIDIAPLIKRGRR